MPKSLRALRGAPILFAALPAVAQESVTRREEIAVTAEKLVGEAIARVNETPARANVVPAKAFGDNRLPVIPEQIFSPVGRRGVFAGVWAAL